MTRPSALRIVAWLFIASGVWALVGIIGSLLIEVRIQIDIDLLGLWVGPGLLHREARYRTWALRLLVIGFFLTPVAGLLLFFQPRSVSVLVFGKRVGIVPLPVALGTLAVMLVISVWEYWVLTRPAVRALFASTAPEDREAAV
jgi:hypothetical protein